MKEKHNKGILVYIETYEGTIRPVSEELLSEAARLSEKTGEPIYGIAVGTGLSQIEEQLSWYRADKIYLYETKQRFLPAVYKVPVVNCIELLKPSIFLIGGTEEGRALAPGIAVAFRTGVTADCTELDLEESGNLIQTRPAFGGNIMASIVTEHARPQIATVRPGTFELCRMLREAVPPQYVRGSMEQAENGMEIIGQTRKAQEKGIEEEQLLVVAGRGIKKKEDLEMIRAFARQIGGGFASSRALVEKGWTTPSQQIGLSGKTAAPKCMITLGVSGTVQFMAGMKHSEHIIAVNEDPEARIFDIAHYPICADLYEVLPELIKVIENLHNRDKYGKLNK